MYGLARRIINDLGSIPPQALGGVISTATHGTGITFKVLPGDVMALTVLYKYSQTGSSSLAPTTSLATSSLLHYQDWAVLASS